MTGYLVRRIFLFISHVWVQIEKKIDSKQEVLLQNTPGPRKALLSQVIGEMLLVSYCCHQQWLPTSWEVKDWYALACSKEYVFLICFKNSEV